MAKKRSIRVGVIGTGFMGKTHLEGIGRMIAERLLPVSLEAIASVQQKKGRALARRLGCRYFSDGASLIADAAVDAVVIASPTDTHLELARLAARAGKPVFLEKPLGRNLAEARKIAGVLDRRDLPHQIGLVLRFAPTYNVLRDLLADPANGEFIFCHFRDDQFFPVRDIYDSDWRSRADKAGGGTLIEHSIHDIDVMHWFFGPARVTGSMVLPSHAPGIEKFAALNLKFERGGCAQLSSIWHQIKPRDNHRRIEIFFANRYYETEGEFTSPIFIQGPKGKMRRLGSDAIERRWRKMVGWRGRKNVDFPATVGYEMYVFLQSLVGGEAPRGPDVEAGLAAHRTIETAYRMGRKQ